MKGRLFRIAFLPTMAAAAMIGGPLRAEPADSRAVPPPHAFIEFCFREPQECPSLAAEKASAMGDGSREAKANYWRLVFETDGPRAISAAADPARPDPATESGGDMAAVAKVNAAVNRSLRESSDQSVYGRGDFWALPLAHGGGAGDCEDFVLEKRRMLRGLGYTEHRMSIAIVRTPWGEKHAVLLVATPQGEVVLDNLSSEVKPWNRSGYALVARQSAEDPSAWVRGR